MLLTNQQVSHLARLARLKLDDKAINETRSQLDSIFTLIAQMQAVDTDGITPMSHPQELFARLRQDVVSESNQRAAFQKIAPQTEDGLYLVPRVVE